MYAKDEVLETHRSNEVRAATLNEVERFFYHRSFDAQDLQRAILAYRPVAELAIEILIRHK